MAKFNAQLQINTLKMSKQQPHIMELNCVVLQTSKFVFHSTTKGIFFYLKFALRYLHFILEKKKSRVSDEERHAAANVRDSVNSSIP